MKKDPVCGMEVEPEPDTPRLEHGGATYYFCSEHCQASFQKDPRRYAGGRPDAPGGAPGA